ncbi:hypothetical protein PpBr36_00111 [Pyricularia pennisetigena]|uniref:hypothetical protein n=1 Tax=Pyricularia pennisetigena TaxID=1578925 RepID=UPI00115197B6|nr:hypothetical protein PpBr36_00111 [Pyricularia pennisetigena]TLS28068.1 hypothetical protein PpBr36_00111 [Pyricularia pennisetigena]
MYLPPVLLQILGTATLCSAAAVKAFAPRDLPTFSPIPPGNLTEEQSVEIVAVALSNEGLPWAEEITMSDTGFRWFVHDPPIKLEGKEPTEGPAVEEKNQKDRRLEGRQNGIKKYISGMDDRVEEKRLAYPFSAMGMINILSHDGKTSKCSGALVGPRLVATARHCLNRDGKGVYTFHPAFHTVDRLPSATVTHAIYIAHPRSSSICNYVDDWAIMVLDKDLSETSGYIGAREFDDNVLNHESLHNYGYPVDLQPDVPYSQSGFTAELDHQNDLDCPKDRPTPMSHQADTASGQSGGPIFTAGEHEDGVYLMGINVAVDPYHGRRALASHGAALMGSIVYARRYFA